MKPEAPALEDQLATIRTLPEAGSLKPFDEKKAQAAAKLIFGLFRSTGSARHAITRPRLVYVLVDGARGTIEPDVARLAVFSAVRAALLMDPPPHPVVWRAMILAWNAVAPGAALTVRVGKSRKAAPVKDDVRRVFYDIDVTGRECLPPAVASPNLPLSRLARRLGYDV